MKYIKNFEIISLFKKRKKLPPVIYKLGKHVRDFIKYNKGENDISDIDIAINKPDNKDNMQILSIYVDTNDTFYQQFRYISLYYNEYYKTLLFSFISKYDYVYIKEYIMSVLDSEKYIIKDKKNIPDNSYFIEFDKIEDLIKDINQSDYELFLLTKKYNL